MSDPELTLAALSARLDRQAAAIRLLRKEVAALQGRDVDAAGADRSAASPSIAAPVEAGTPRSGTPGVFVPVPTCHVCSKTKEAGRIELTCKACGRHRHTIITTRGADRTSIMFDACTNCGAGKKPHTKMLCDPCSEAFATWKASLT